jgi:hypothetical protein
LIIRFIDGTEKTLVINDSLIVKEVHAQIWDKLKWKRDDGIQFALAHIDDSTDISVANGSLIILYYSFINFIFYYSILLYYTILFR